MSPHSDESVGWKIVLGEYPHKLLMSVLPQDLENIFQCICRALCLQFRAFHALLSDLDFRRKLQRYVSGITGKLASKKSVPRWQLSAKLPSLDRFFLSKT